MLSIDDPGMAATDGWLSTPTLTLSQIRTFWTDFIPHFVLARLLLFVQVSKGLSIDIRSILCGVFRHRLDLTAW